MYALGQRLDWCGPIIDLVPQINVLDIARLLVEELIAYLQLVQLADLFLR